MNKVAETNTDLPSVKVWGDQRVVTFRDIDEAHNRPSGTARRSFNKNKKHFIQGTDYIVRNSHEAKSEYGITAPNGLTLVTETGYLMITKSFTDDLSWSVQRQLVNNYFQKESVPQAALPEEPDPFADCCITKVQPSASHGAWFRRNNWKLKIIMERFDWTRKFLYHKILTELSDLYDLEVVERFYVYQYGHEPEYKMQLLDCDKTLARTATRYINYLLTEEYC